jgi:hypothetical protein
MIPCLLYRDHGLVKTTPRTGNAAKGYDQGQELDRVGGYPVGRNHDMNDKASYEVSVISAASG